MEKYKLALLTEKRSKSRNPRRGGNWRKNRRQKFRRGRTKKPRTNRWWGGTAGYEAGRWRSPFFFPSAPCRSANPFTRSSVAVIFCQVSRERSNPRGSSARRGERSSRCWQPSGSQPVSLIGNKRSNPFSPLFLLPRSASIFIARKPAGLSSKLNPVASCTITFHLFPRPVLAALLPSPATRSPPSGDFLASVLRKFDFPSAREPIFLSLVCGESSSERFPRYPSR